MVSFFSSAPSRRGRLKAVSLLAFSSEIADLAGLLGLAALRASILPAPGPKAMAAIQWVACEVPPYSRAAATAGVSS